MKYRLECVFSSSDDRPELHLADVLCSSLSLPYFHDEIADYISDTICEGEEILIKSFGKEHDYFLSSIIINSIGDDEE